MEPEHAELSAEQETAHLDLSTPEMTERFAEAPVFVKSGVVAAIQATERQEVKTVLPDGREETVNTAEAGDYVVTNQRGEKYVIKPDVFAKRYEAQEDGSYRAKGVCRAFANPTGAEITIMAPWGEEQTGDSNCMLAATIDPDYPEAVGNHRHIIEREEFEQSYAPAPVSTSST